MRRGHLAALEPLCPVCRSRGEAAPLELARALREEGEHLLEGILHCPRPECLREYPVIDGVPLLIADLRAWVGSQLLPLLGREDLPAELESLIGDCCGPGSAFDTTRQHLSAYAWGHWGDLDPETAGTLTPAPGGMDSRLRGNDDREAASTSGLLDLLAIGLDLGSPFPDGPVLDLGCAVGRATFELADRLERLAVGVDLGAAFLRTAARVLQRGEVLYPQRRVGLVYDRRRFALALPAASRVDFWAADAAGLPFADGRFAAVFALNLLDCVASPVAVLGEIARVLLPGGRAVLAVPYDWSPAATPFTGWLGGHSQRGEGEGASEPLLRTLLTPGGHPAAPGLRLIAERHALPWQVRLHERATMSYQTHLLVAEKEPGGPTHRSAPTEEPSGP